MIKKPKRQIRRVVKKPSKKQSVNYSGVILVFLIFLTVFAYIFRAIVDYVNKPDISFGLVAYGTVDIPHEINALIVRDEQVYKANASGKLSFNYNEYDKIRKSSTVCNILDEQAALEIAAGMSKIDQKILNIQQNMRGDISVFYEDAQLKNKQIKKAVDSNIPKFLATDTSTLYNFKETVSQNVNIRNQILLSENRGSIEGMVDERERFDVELSKTKSTIVAEKGGILSYFVDGFEEVLTIESIDKITPEHLRMTFEQKDTSTNKNVQAEDKVFKIVQSNDWLIASYIPNNLSYEFKEGDFRTIYVSQNKNFIPLEMEIVKIVKGEQEDFVVFKCSRDIIDFLAVRNIKIKTVDTKHKGYKIAKAAVVDKTLLKIPNEYVYETNSGATIIKRSDILDEPIIIDINSKDEIYTYLLLDYKNLNIGDILVLPEDREKTFSVSEIENVKGVYKVNKGYAKFTKIIIDENTPETNGYYILDPAINKTIMISDRIITDAKNIIEGQIVY